MAVAPLPVYSAALEAFRRGWSVIPLRGGADPGQGKAPTIGWQTFQQRPPTFSDLAMWFLEKSAPAYGVVCGRVSRLIVLDFDDPHAADEFAGAFPALAQTYTVRSGLRGTPHLYFEVNFAVKSQKLRGGDLKGEGGYVVGAGSVVAGHTWQPLNNHPVKPLTQADLTAILDHFRLHTDAPPAPAPQLVSAPAAAKPPTVASKPAAVTLHSLREHYRTHAVVGRRNNVLFQLAMQARDHGLSLSTTVIALADLHAETLAAGERLEPRRREAERTIASAYQRPSGRPQGKIVKLPDPDQIDNGLREALLKRPDGVAFLRVYEGLRLSGLASGATVTHAEARRLLAGVVGDHSIRRALAFKIQTAAQADGEGRSDKAKTCFVPQTEPTKNRRGRPLTHYTLPSPVDLRRWLGLKLTVSDPIAPEDLASRRQYRAALEREFIRRCPGQYPQPWLAERLGVSVRSIYTYHRLAGITATACFKTSIITLDNYAALLPTKEAAKAAGVRYEGRFIEDEQGRRYQPSAKTARRLLRKGRRLLLRERTFSYYHLDPPAAPVLKLPEQPIARLTPETVQARIAAADARMQARFTGQIPDLQTPPPIVREPQIGGFAEPIPFTPLPLKPTQPTQPHLLPDVPPPVRKQRQAYYPEPLADPDDEAAAQQIYSTLKQTLDQTAFSLSSARCLIDLYGRGGVLHTLRQMIAMHREGKLNNPVGFLVAAARVQWRTEHNAPAPRWQGESRSKTQQTSSALP